MRIIAGLWIATMILSICGCSRPPGPLNNTQDRNASAGGETKPTKGAQTYPILRFSRDQGSDVLLRHEATDAEKQLFKKMDSAVIALKGDADLDRCHEAIIPIGREAGLEEEDSIAFWTRMTFSEYEP